MRSRSSSTLLASLVAAGDGVAVDVAVVGGRLERLLRHGVDDVGGDELGDVERVGVGGVLDAGGGPQRALRVGARRRRASPSAAVAKTSSKTW